MKLKGILLYAWHNELFKIIGEKYGKYIGAEMKIEMKRKFNYTFILLEVERVSLIIGIVNLQVIGRKVGI